MEDIYVIGISKDYTPPSSAFSINSNNFTFLINDDVDVITKVSCSASGNIEEIFTSLNTNYATVYASIDINVYYMCSDNTINVHRLTLDKLIYINLGKNIYKKNFNVDTEVLDLDIIYCEDNKLTMYTILLVCLY